MSKWSCLPWCSFRIGNDADRLGRQWLSQMTILWLWLMFWLFFVLCWFPHHIDIAYFVFLAPFILGTAPLFPCCKRQAYHSLDDLAHASLDPKIRYSCGFPFLVGRNSYHTPLGACCNSRTWIGTSGQSYNVLTDYRYVRI